MIEVAIASVIAVAATGAALTVGVPLFDAQEPLAGKLQGDLDGELASEFQDPGEPSEKEAFDDKVADAS